MALSAEIKTPERLTRTFIKHCTSEKKCFLKFNPFVWLIRKKLLNARATGWGRLEFYFFKHHEKRARREERGGGNEILFYVIEYGIMFVICARQRHEEGGWNCYHAKAERQIVMNGLSRGMFLPSIASMSWQI
jgi:hypothetical protein